MMKMFGLNKKGANKVYWTIIGAVIAVLAVSIFIIGANNSTKAERFILQFYGEDLSMLMETLQGVPEDVIINYPIEKDYHFWLNETSLKLNYETDELMIKRNFKVLPGMTFQGGYGEGILTFKKIGNSIVLSSNKIFEEESTALDFEKVEELLVNVRANYPEIGSVLSISELNIIKDDFNIYLENNELEKTDSITDADVIITLNSKKIDDESKFKIIMPVAEGTTKAKYGAIISLYKDALRANGLMNLEELEETNADVTDNLDFKFEFYIKQDEKDEFMRKKNDYVSEFVKILKLLKEESQ
jgi:hypothetical protein